ncbi:MAG: alpha/beta hydrolase fold domain-containing protein [Coleofasciculus sp. G1-WW12-02]|uniref:alpha/beta hydrolase fold domain-containing protein n=1 Tax=Coleofasciculus sp. G1-WW12-02 TaxID=3068483 RepID=UPI0032F38394
MSICERRFLILADIIAPQYHFPAQLEDVQAALSYIQSHAHELEIDTERIALISLISPASEYRSHMIPHFSQKARLRIAETLPDKDLSPFIHSQLHRTVCCA